MIEVIRGTSEKPVSSQRLVDYFSNKEDIQGILYIGYPIVGVSSGSLPLDAILVSREHGVVIFDVEEGAELKNRQDERDIIFNNVQAKLLQHKNLVNGRKLKFEISILTYAPSVVNNTKTEEVVNTEDELDTYLTSGIQNLEDETYRNLVSVIQIVTNLRKTQKRNDVITVNSKGDKINKLESSIANLDRTQSAAVIETTEGPQRIRGLAGSGKTIILALKVAYLHTIHSDWDIAVTFNSRSLRGQFIDLITKFTIESKSEEPDWSKIKILHAWGSEKMPGIYSDVCSKYGLEYSDFGSARNKTRYKDVFGHVCMDALNQIEVIEKNGTLPGIYDAILIDEAQDFSDQFLKLCFKILKEPKRLIWAYDELQNLTDISIKSSEELFKISLRNEIGKPKQDIILEKCYRNSRPILVTAQALGFGIYRDEGLVQMFDRPALWEEIGYSVEDGDLSIGQHVVLKRTNDTSPEFLESHSNIDDLIIFKDFENNKEQTDWVASEIIKNLKEEELEHRDIVVINCDPVTTEKAVGPIREILLKNGISNHIAGVTHSPDKFYLDNSVTFTGIHRAKGNEAPMIYIINSQYSFEGYDLIRKRNILFTALTRSKAWVRVCGFGGNMKKLKDEYEKIKSNDFKLDFQYPTKEEMNKLNVIHREMTKDEKNAINEANKDLKKFIDSVDEGVIKKEDVDPSSLEKIKTLFDAQK